MLKNISVNKLDVNNNIIIDIRDKEKYNTSHIPNSVHIENDKLINNPNDYINKEDVYYIYCQHGKTSLKTCIKLSKLGYNVINIMGGYDEWLIKN